jgi:hypothetical protein
MKYLDRWIYHSSYTDERGVHFVTLVGNLYRLDGYEPSIYDEENVYDFNYALKIGYAILNPTDKNINDKGIKIASGRAEQNSIISLASFYKRVIYNQAFNILKNEFEILALDPNKYIKSYKRIK